MMKSELEQERLQKLLCHLRRGSLNDVSSDLLLEPRPGTRPSVMLVAHYPWLQQVLMGNFSLLEIIKLAAVTGLWAIALVEGLQTWVLAHASALWQRDVVQLFLDVVWGLTVVATILVVLNLRGRFSWTCNHLTLGLNEMCHAAPDRLQQVPWHDVYTVSKGGMGWVRVDLENGNVVFLRVPKADRATLIAIMQELVRHHHHDLHGLATTADNTC